MELELLEGLARGDALMAELKRRFLTDEPVRELLSEFKALNGRLDELADRWLARGVVRRRATRACPLPPQ